MRKFLTGIFIFVFLLLSTSLLPFNITYADPYDCQHFGTHQCISLHASTTCVSGKPQVSLSWNNPHGDSSFTIVYSHDGHWYMKFINSATSTTIPTYGGHQDGGSAGDPGFNATGGYFGAKISGGIPGYYGGSGLTTGYSTPDTTASMPNCTVPTPTPTHAPTPTPPGPTATPTPAPATTLNIALQLPGIGAGGNLSPKHTIRNSLHVSIYKSTDDPSQPNISPVFDAKNLSLTYHSDTGYFTNGNVQLNNISTGDYQVLVKVSGYLRKEFVDPTTSANTVHITAGTNTTVPLIKLIPGDIAALYNVLDVSDFYALVGCYKDKASTSSCTIDPQVADINDDGVVDGIDLNYWLLGMNTALQDNPNNPGNGDGVTGD